MTFQNMDRNALQGTFFFDPDDRIYAHHFPGHPVVPGSMIVRAFMLAGEKLGLCENLCAIENFRFKRFISPGEYAYNMAIFEDGLKCTLYDGPSVVVTGTLK